MVFLQPDPFLNELTSMFERNREKGSVWVSFKRSSMKSKVERNKMTTSKDSIEYRCLIRATDGKHKISTTEISNECNQTVSPSDLNVIPEDVQVGAKDHQRFQASYATLLKAHMAALKKRERKDKKKAADGDKKDAGSNKKSKRV